MTHLKNHEIEVLVEDIAQLIDKAYGFKAVRDGDMDALYGLVKHYGRKRQYYVMGRLFGEENNGGFYQGHTLLEAVQAHLTELKECYDPEDFQRLYDDAFYLETAIEEPPDVEGAGPIMHINCGDVRTEEGLAVEQILLDEKKKNRLLKQL